MIANLLGWITLGLLVLIAVGVFTHKLDLSKLLKRLESHLPMSDPLPQPIGPIWSSELIPAQSAPPSHLTFDPSLYPTPASRVQALHNLIGTAPLGTPVLTPDGRTVDVQGNPIGEGRGAASSIQRSVLPWSQGAQSSQPGRAGQPTSFTFEAPYAAHVQLSIPYGPFTGDKVRNIVAKFDDDAPEHLMVTAVAGVIHRNVASGQHRLVLTPDGDTEIRVVLNYS